jgi:hypothetical protein
MCDFFEGRCICEMCDNDVNKNCLSILTIMRTTFRGNETTVMTKNLVPSPIKIRTEIHTNTILYRGLRIFLIDVFLAFLIIA